jgi:ATP-dependent 26S proteasome regulatory subunit
MRPLYDFGFLALPDDLLDDIMAAIDVINVEERVFDEWGLRAIEPFPKTALNFYGPPGTGKTLAAHAVAGRLGRPIICADYSQIESKFHGDGPKNMDALFHAAARDGAVLFMDEADSLLSKRLTNVSQGSEQAINSLRSQILICLERFRGVVIFATNLVENYDRAFETRVRHIRFDMPDAACRRRIWAAHLPEPLPRGACVCLDTLSGIDGICGRDIKNAVIDAAVRAARAGSDAVTLADLSGAVERIKAARIAAKPENSLDEDEQAEAGGRVRAMLANEESNGGAANA